NKIAYGNLRRPEHPGSVCPSGTAGTDTRVLPRAYPQLMESPTLGQTGRAVFSWGVERTAHPLIPHSDSSVRTSSTIGCTSYVSCIYRLLHCSYRPTR